MIIVGLESVDIKGGLWLEAFQALSHKNAFISFYLRLNEIITLLIFNSMILKEKKERDEQIYYRSANLRFVPRMNDNKKI